MEKKNSCQKKIFVKKKFSNKFLVQNNLVKKKSGKKLVYKILVGSTLGGADHSPPQVETRNPEKFYVTKARTDRLANSAIPYMQKLLNSNWK